MAWTDQCRISAVQTIKKVSEDTGLSVRKAIAAVSKESDIPPETLQKWYYPRQKVEAKNGPTARTDEDEILRMADEILLRRKLKENLLNAANDLLEDKCLAGCDADPAHCIVKKFLAIVEEI